MNKKFQIFTPDGYVKKLLDCVQYCENIYDKNILENSCGEMCIRDSNKAI